MQVFKDFSAFKLCIAENTSETIADAASEALPMDYFKAATRIIGPLAETMRTDAGCLAVKSLLELQEKREGEAAAVKAADAPADECKGETAVGPEVKAADTAGSGCQADAVDTPEKKRAAEGKTGDDHRGPPAKKSVEEKHPVTGKSDDVGPAGDKAVGDDSHWKKGDAVIFKAFQHKEIYDQQPAIVVANNSSVVRIRFTDSDQGPYQRRPQGQGAIAPP